MASPNSDQEITGLYKFTKVLTLKVAQIVVQSRQGKKLSHNKPAEYNLSCSSVNAQWFNLAIPDEPDIDSDTKHVLNGEVMAALNNILCIEISLKTLDGDEMVLELWTVRMTSERDTILTSISTISNRMSIMLKSTLSISRITPGYKMSRSQNRESYKIFHKIYGGPVNTDLLGENYKTIKISELCTCLGTIVIEVRYRTKLTILPDEKPKIIEKNQVQGNTDIIVKNDHFPKESPRKKYYEKKELDLNKPLTAGAFVDTETLKEIHDALSFQLPPEPPLSWLLNDNDTAVNNNKSNTSESAKNGSQEAEGSSPTAYVVSSHAASKAIEMPKRKEKITTLLEFPFADGSPITELANFYHECLRAESVSDEWTDIVQASNSVSSDHEGVSQQLKMFEEAAPEFDNMVASMFSNSENDTDNLS